MAGSSGDPQAGAVTSAGPTRPQRVVGRIGQVCAVCWVVLWCIPVVVEPMVLILGGFMALLVGAPLWAVATGVRSPHRSTRMLCAWCALPGVVMPTFLIYGNWSVSTVSGRLLWLGISGPIILTCLAIFVVTLVSDHRRHHPAHSRRPPETGVNLSDPWTRFSIIAIAAVSITLMVLGAVAKQAAPVIEHGAWTEPNEALLSPGNEFKFYGAAVAVLILGLLGVWAASRLHDGADGA